MVYLKSPILYPCVIKPVHGSGSRGVKLCKTEDQYQQAVEMLLTRGYETLSEYKLERRWLLERYVEGDIYGAQFIWMENKWELLGITKEFLSQGDSLVLQGIVFPSGLSNDLVEKLKLEFIQWLDCLDLQGGALEIEFKMVDCHPVLIEINPRLVGAMVPELLSLSLGQSIHRYLVEECCGITRPFENLKECDGYFAQLFLYSEFDGTIVQLRGIDNIAGHLGVISAHFKSVAFSTSKPNNINDNIGYVITFGDTINAAVSNAKIALGSIEIIFKKDLLKGHRFWNIPSQPDGNDCLAKEWPKREFVS